jgi:hypothetical protein
LKNPKFGSNSWALPLLLKIIFLTALTMLFIPGNENRFLKQTFAEETENSV